MDEGGRDQGEELQEDGSTRRSWSGLETDI